MHNMDRILWTLYHPIHIVTIVTKISIQLVLQFLFTGANEPCLLSVFQHDSATVHKVRSMWIAKVGVEELWPEQMLFCSAWLPVAFL